jgi:hypothetical protein
VTLTSIAGRAILRVKEAHRHVVNAKAATQATRSAGRKVLATMAEMGLAVEAKVEFQFDPELPIMGYSRPLRNGYRVVAGNGALQDGLLVTLLAHELSHVQRMASGHPSHSHAAIQAAYDGVRLDGPREPYHDEILHDAINNVEDLYADGIAFQVMQNLGAVPTDGIGGFFLAWMKAKPQPGRDARETRWRATHAMLGNARALAQVKGGGSAKQVRDAKRINAQLLRVVPSDVAKAQPWFQAFLDDLPADLTEESFTTDLAEYVQRFVAVAEGRRAGRDAA